MYELLKEDNDTYTLKHKDGTEFMVAKQAIGNAIRNKISNFGKGPQKLAHGGAVRSEADAPDDSISGALDALNAPVGTFGYSQDQSQMPPIPVATPVQDYASMSSQPTPSPLPAPNQSSGLIASNAGIPAAALQQPPVSINGEATPKQDGIQSLGSKTGSPKFDALQSMADIQKQQGAAINLQSKAQQDLAKEQMQILGQQRLEQEQQYSDHVARMARIDRDGQQLSDAIMNQKIDPNRLWNESSTGGKISAAIGLILGGIGAGLTGGPNQALGVINKMIDRDIDAQRAELGKKHTLFSMNMQKLGNEQAAYTATKLQLASTVDGQLRMAAAKSQVPQAQAAALQAQAMLKQQMLQPQIEYSKFLGAQNLMYGHGGGGSEANQARAEEMLLDKDQKERLVHLPGPGGTRIPRLASTPKDAEKFKESEEANTEFENAVKDAIKWSQDKGTSWWKSSDKEIGDQKLEHVTMLMSKLHGLNRLSDTDLHEFKQMVPSDLGAMRQDLVQAKLMNLLNMSQEKRNAVYKAYAPGYNPGAFQSQMGAPKR